MVPSDSTVLIIITSSYLLKARENPIPTPVSSMATAIPGHHWWGLMIALLPHLEGYLFSITTRVVFTLSATYHVVQPESPTLESASLKPLLAPISLGWFPRKQAPRRSLPRGSWLRSVFRTISVEEGRTRVVQKNGLSCDSHSISVDAHRSSAVGSTLSQENWVFILIHHQGISL